ncbi:BNR-4 repeat-containing protein [Pseudopedobacter sp.]|uniref:BNR-4 repeat-containing protein n=1 Tax=Pseudopedobacter sp. TaxID=1936787 RepID=UPI0033415613
MYYTKHNKKIKSIVVLFITLLCNVYGYSQIVPSVSEYPVIAKDATWCWFADPRAVYYKGKHEKIYYGYINTKGDVVISSRDANTKEIHTYILNEKLQVDDHNVPSILFLPDGKILTFYTEHNGRFFMRKSKNAEDISEWEEEKVLSFGLKNQLICYSHPVMLSAENNRIYMFFRSRNKRIPDNPKYADWRQNYAYSDDFGKTWTDAQYYLSSKGDYNKVPYLKIVSDNKSKIHFLFTDGHPKLGLSSVYHAYYEKGKFHQTNGDVISDVKEGPLDIRKINKIYDSDKGKIKSWIWDIALDKKGKPVVTYAQYPSVKDHIYHYARWNGKQWLDREIINSGKYITSPEKTGAVLEEHYSGGVVLDHYNPDNIFLSRQVNGVFEIEHWKLNGKDWKTKAITHNSKSNNIRPYVVDNFKGKEPLVMWMNGVYEHYVRYKTDLLINKE